MKQSNVIALLFILLIGCKEKGAGTSTTDIKEAGAAKAKATIKTPGHVKVPYSNFYVIPPAGFALNPLNELAAANEGYAHFMMMNILSGSTPEKFFGELKADADKNFPGSWKEEKIIADGHEAIIYFYKTAGFLQHYLRFTDGYTEEMLVAIFIESEAAIGKEMYEAMKTVVVEN